MIPKKFTIGAKTYKVSIKEKVDIEGSLVMGAMSPTTKEVEISKNLYGEDFDEAEMLQTFNHELVHAILHGMGESDLFNNERFVEGFAQLLTQYELTRKF